MQEMKKYDPEKRGAGYAWAALIGAVALYDAIRWKPCLMDLVALDTARIRLYDMAHRLQLYIPRCIYSTRSVSMICLISLLIGSMITLLRVRIYRNMLYFQ